MNGIWTALLYMGTAGLVGGITNHLAIKMLFHPRKPLYIFGWKLPFTPGLIPKRKEEISRSLGEVVSEYLVTAEGLAGALRKPELKLGIEHRLQAMLDTVIHSERTIEQWALQYWTDEEWSAIKARFASFLRAESTRAMDWLWESQELAGKRLAELIPGWNEEGTRHLVQSAARSITEGIKEEISSMQGERMLRKVTGQLLERTGGFLGTLAGIFMDEDKMAVKIRKALLDQLDSEPVQAALQRFLSGKINELGQMTLSEALNWLFATNKDEEKEEGLDRLKAYISQMNWEGWAERLAQIRLQHLLRERQEWISGKIPAAVEWSIGQLEKRLPGMIKTINLPAIVEEQVSQFPVEQLEQVILSVSGREFRAITWLGVLLGAMIGLMQTILMMLQ